MNISTRSPIRTRSRENLLEGSSSSSSSHSTSSQSSGNSGALISTRTRENLFPLRPNGGRILNVSSLEPLNAGEKRLEPSGQRHDNILPFQPIPRVGESQSVSSSISMLGNRATSNVRFKIRVLLEVKGAVRSASIKSYPETFVTGENCDSLLKNIFDMCKEHIRGNYTKPDGRPVLTIATESEKTYENFHSFVMVSRPARGNRSRPLKFIIDLIIYLI